MFFPVIETFTVLGLKENVKLSGNVPDNTLQWEGVENLDGYIQVFEV